MPLSFEGLNENCSNYKEEIEKIKTENETKIADINQVNQTNTELIKKANEQAQTAMSKEITELNLSLKNQQANYEELMMNLNAKKGEYLELNEQLRERNQELSLAKLEIEVNKKEMDKLNSEVTYFDQIELKNKNFKFF